MVGGTGMMELKDHGDFSKSYFNSTTVKYPYGIVNKIERKSASAALCPDYLATDGFGCSRRKESCRKIFSAYQKQNEST